MPRIGQRVLDRDLASARGVFAGFCACENAGLNVLNVIDRHFIKKHSPDDGLNIALQYTFFLLDCCLAFQSHEIKVSINERRNGYSSFEAFRLFLPLRNRIAAISVNLLIERVILAARPADGPLGILADGDPSVLPSALVFVNE